MLALEANSSTRNLVPFHFLYWSILLYCILQLSGQYEEFQRNNGRSSLRAPVIATL